MKKLEKGILSIIKVALTEDIGRQDITTKLTVPDKAKIKAVISAKEQGIACGLNVARLAFKSVDKRVRFRALTSDGRKVRKGGILARIEGRAKSILKAERVALNFLSHLSGIATLTHRFVQRIKPYRVKIMDTRKTTPGLRYLEKYAVRCGGGFNHRMGLWDQILIKDNHLSAIGYQLSAISLKAVIKKIKKKKPRGVKIEIEVKNLRQFKQALDAGPDIIMLDNFSLKSIREAVRLRNQKPEYRNRKLEVSGRVNLNNVRRIAACGVEAISVGELTHSSRALDVALNCE